MKGVMEMKGVMGGGGGMMGCGSGTGKQTFG